MQKVQWCYFILKLEFNAVLTEGPRACSPCSNTRRSGEVKQLAPQKSLSMATARLSPSLWAQRGLRLHPLCSGAFCRRENYLVKGHKAVPCLLMQVLHLHRAARNVCSRIWYNSWNTNAVWGPQQIWSSGLWLHSRFHGKAFLSISFSL